MKYIIDEIPPSYNRFGGIKRTMTCKDCRYFKYCLENSRNYPCRDFKKKREMKKND